MTTIQNNEPLDCFAIAQQVLTAATFHWKHMQLLLTFLIISDDLFDQKPTGSIILRVKAEVWLISN